ncbi:MAG: gliding motility-associated C-terminal domain-containing protein [Chitinophagaceae bacterium]
MKYLLILLSLVTLSACNKDVAGGGACSLGNQAYIFNQGGAKFALPNAFTPNGDGRNDYFRPISSTGLTNLSMTITDKGGNVVFRTIDLYTQGWDGKNSGYLLESGKYAVNFQFTTVNGDHVNQSLCIALLAYSAANCIPRVMGETYYFGDQFDPVTLQPIYATAENFCP